MIKTINLVKDLGYYGAHLLSYPDIGNTKIERDTFVSDTGITFYGNERLSFTPLTFSIEFKGEKETIRENRNKLSRILEKARITFDDEIFYKGRFLGEKIDTKYFFEVVEFSGQAIASLDTQSTLIPINETISIYNRGNLLTPCTIILEGKGENIKITGFESDIKINKFNDKLVIDSERGFYKLGAETNIDMLEFPYIKEELNIKLTGQGDFTCKLEFEGRVIC